MYLGEIDMEKINRKWILLAGVIIIFLSVVIIFLCNLADYSPFQIISVGTNSDWIGFWGSMLGAIFGVIGTFLVLQIQIRKDSERFEQTQLDNTFFNMLELFQKVQEGVGSKQYVGYEPGFDKNNDIVSVEKNIDIFSKIFNEIAERKDDLRNLKKEEYSQKLFEQTDEEYKQKIKLDLNKLLKPIEYADPTDPWYDVKHNFINVIKSLEEGKFKDFCSNMNVLSSSLQNPITELNEEGSICISEAKKLKENIEFKKYKYRYIFKEQDILKIVDEVFAYYHSDIGNYLRVFHRLVKLIMNSNLNMNKKKEYLGIVRALLSSTELLVVFYNTFYSSRGSGLKNQLSIKDKNNKKTEFFADKQDIEKFNINTDNGTIDLPFFKYDDLIFEEIDFSHIKALVND